MTYWLIEKPGDGNPKPYLVSLIEEGHWEAFGKPTLQFDFGSILEASWFVKNSRKMAKKLGSKRLVIYGDCAKADLLSARHHLKFEERVGKHYRSIDLTTMPAWVYRRAMSRRMWG